MLNGIHWAGQPISGTRVGRPARYHAVNPDPNRGRARGKADVLYVADAFEVMGKVNALLAVKK